MLSATSKIWISCIVLVVVFEVCNVQAQQRRGRKLNRRKRFIEWGPDIAGPYCETRRDGCCPGRIDECSVPILDTLCYCDEFCNRTRGDCCPDFFSFCHGQQQFSTPAPNLGACQLNDRPYPPAAEITLNCQKCKCSPDSNSKSGFSFRCDGQICLIRDKVINGVNSGRYGWQASNYSDFWGMTLREGMQYRLGTHKPADYVLNMSPIDVTPQRSLPRRFDARQKWPNFIHGIRDQGNCGASWAFSTTALAADRLSIESKGHVLDDFAPQHLMSCNNAYQDGCEGGHLDSAWWYLRKRGVSTEDCYPYESGQTNKAGRCKLGRRQSSGVCPSGIPFSPTKIYQATPPYRIAQKERHIMQEIFSNGPVQATFKVKDDFFMYKSGVYRHVRAVSEPISIDEKRTYHSVRIIGWGLDSVTNEKYWLCANSWGPNWGEGGYFRIARGVDECDIESFVIGAWGKVEGDIELQRLLQTFRSERQRQRFLQGRNNQRRRRRRHLRRKHKKHHKQHN